MEMTVCSQIREKLIWAGKSVGPHIFNFPQKKNNAILINASHLHCRPSFSQERKLEGGWGGVCLIVII